MIFPDLCGRKFGTILVDLDAHQVIDLLSERSSQTSADWMRKHPEIDYVSRDRGKDYATSEPVIRHHKQSKSRIVFT